MGARAEVVGTLGKGTQDSPCAIGSSAITKLTLCRRLSPEAYFSASINRLS